MTAPRAALTLPRPIQRRLESALLGLLLAEGADQEDFGLPPREAALIAPDSVSWRVFKNPLALFIGGVTAVVLELAEPRVRSGVWEHTSFQTQPLARLRRTGYATMMTVYGPSSRAESMIARIGRMHESVRGHTPDGRAYCAADPELLTWVQATACFGFLEAYHASVHPLDADQRDRYYAEGMPAARLYGAVSAPQSQLAAEALFNSMSGQLERSDIVFEFLRIVRHMPVLPAPVRPLQSVLIKAAVQTIPASIRQRMGLDRRWDLTPWQRSLLCGTGAAVDRLMLRTSPAVQACRRLGLPDDYLYGPNRER